MIFKIADLLAPHHCLNCQKIGSILCDCCKKDFLNSPNMKLKQNYGFDQIYCFGQNKGLLKKLIYHYKLDSTPEIAEILAEIILKTLPDSNFIIIPLTGHNFNIKARGFDHIKLITDNLQQKSKIKVLDCLQNQAQKAQKDLSAQERLKNVQNAFICSKRLIPKERYLLFDDILTTGASTKSCLKVLKSAGAKHVSLLILAKS